MAKCTIFTKTCFLTILKDYSNLDWKGLGFASSGRFSVAFSVNGLCFFFISAHHFHLSSCSWRLEGQKRARRSRKLPSLESSIAPCGILDLANPFNTNCYKFLSFSEKFGQMVNLENSVCWYLAFVSSFLVSC